MMQNKILLSCGPVAKGLQQTVTVLGLLSDSAWDKAVISAVISTFKLFV